MELGAAGGVSYREEGWSKKLKALAGGGFDVTIDSAGGEGFLQLIELAAPGGRIAFFGATVGDPDKLPMRRIFWKQLSILGTTMGSPADFAAMVRFVEEHRLVPLGGPGVPAGRRRRGTHGHGAVGGFRQDRADNQRNDRHRRAHLAPAREVPGVRKTRALPRLGRLDGAVPALQENAFAPLGLSVKARPSRLGRSRV